MLRCKSAGSKRKRPLRRLATWLIAPPSSFCWSFSSERLIPRVRQTFFYLLAAATDGAAKYFAFPSLQFFRRQSARQCVRRGVLLPQMAAPRVLRVLLLRAATGL